MSKQIIKASDEAWESRSLGADENFVGVISDELASAIDDGAGTQLISIRIQKSLIEDLKLIASLNKNIGYQTLIKQILQRFVECEKKQLFRDLVSEKLEKTVQQPSAVDCALPAKTRSRKVA